MSFDQLPDEVLQLVFQYLSTQQRLQVAAQVCRRFKRVANATKIISTKLTGHRRDMLAIWLSTYGWSVRTLKAAAAEAEPGRYGGLEAEPLLHVIHLLPQLDRLELTGFDVPIAPGCVGGLASSTHLTALRLEGCIMGRLFIGYPINNSLDGIEALTNLQSLKLTGHVLPATLPQKLALLTELECSTTITDAPSLHNLSLLPLRRLVLSALDVSGKEVAVSDALTSITSLESLELHSVGAVICPFSCLQHLQTLSISTNSEDLFLAGRRPLPPFGRHTSCVDSAALAGLSGLQHLSLRGVIITRTVEGSPGLLRESCNDKQTFLEAISAMTQLTYLSLDLCDGPFYRAERANPQRFAALTASNHLQELHLCMRESVFEPRIAPGEDRPPYSAKSREQGDTLPAGTWAHVFPADRQLTALRVLRVHPGYTSLADNDLTALGKCCPNLQDLELLGVLGSTNSNASGGVLLLGREPRHFRQLRSLTVDNLDTAAAMKLTDTAAATLKRLHVKSKAVLSDLGLLQMTKLRALQELKMEQAVVSYDTWAKWEGAIHMCTQEAHPDNPPGVWMELLEHCILAMTACRMASPVPPSFDTSSTALEVQEELQAAVEEMAEYKASPVGLAVWQAAADALTAYQRQVVDWEGPTFQPSCY